MRSTALYGGKSVMKLDPFLVVGSFFATGTAAVNRGYPIEFMMAIAVGSFLALLHSYWKSRQRKADGIDTALWAMIATIGSFALAFFVAPSLEGKILPVVHITLTLPMAAFLISVSATPFIEWLLTGEAFKLVKKLIEKWFGDKESTI